MEPTLDEPRSEYGAHEAPHAARRSDLHRFGRLVVLDKLATGGMAEVFKVSDPERPGACLALKRVRSDWDEDPSYRRMLLEEAQLVRRLDHGNVARVFETVEHEGRLGVLMELVEGIDLERLLRIRRRGGSAAFPVEVAVYALGQLLEGLDFVHDARDEGGRYLNVVHRDVSPGNVMIDACGKVKLVDFGIAKAAGSVASTEAGNVKGKFRYMAPEQIRGEAPEPATDVYAAGLVLWEMLAGVRIYEGIGIAHLMLNVANGKVPDLREHRPDLPEGVYAALDRATAAKAEDRFPSAKAFQEALAAAVFELSEPACRDTLSEWVRAARASESKQGLERALERAKGVASGLEDAILAALEEPDRVGGSHSPISAALEEPDRVSGSDPAHVAEDAAPPRNPRETQERPPLPKPARSSLDTAEIIPRLGGTKRPSRRAQPLIEGVPPPSRRSPPPVPESTDTDVAAAPWPKQ